MDRSSKGTAFIQWAEEVPADWSSVRLRNLLTSVLAGNWGYDPGSSDIDLLCARIADFDWNRLEIRDENIHTRRSYTHDQAKRFVLESGDLLVEKSGGGEKHPVGRCVQYQGEGGPAFANFAMRLRVNESVSSGFLCYSLAASYYRGHSWKILNQTTGIQNLDVSAFRSSPIPLPPRAEQRAIVDFLDAKTAEIDGLVGKLERQVELLERYRRELIARTVTRGLDPDVPMKDSGVDWIGSMPRTWSTIPVRRLFEVVKRVEPGFSDQVLSITQRGIVPKDLSSHFGQIAESYDSYQRVDVGDYAMNAMDLLTGWVDRSKYQGITSPDYRVFRLRPQIGADPRYFTHVLQMGYTRRIFYRFGQGVSNLGRWRLQPKVFLSMRFPLPPLDEQVAIADHIEGKHAEIDSTIEGINRQIELLGKYRKQVINDAVTGKVPVGEVA